MYLFISLPIYLSECLTLFPPVCLWFSLWFCLSLCPSVSLSVSFYLCIYEFLYLCIYWNMYIYIIAFIYLSIYAFNSLSIALFVNYQTIYLCLNLQDKTQTRKLWIRILKLYVPTCLATYLPTRLLTYHILFSNMSFPR